MKANVTWLNLIHEHKISYAINRLSDAIIAFITNIKIIIWLQLANIFTVISVTMCQETIKSLQFEA